MEEIWEKTQKEWIKNLLLAYKPNHLSENLWGRMSEMVGYFNQDMKDCSNGTEQGITPLTQRMEPPSTTVIERSGEPKRVVCSPDLPVFSLTRAFEEVAAESTVASTQEKDYQCSFCNKTFTQKTIFQNHMRSHGKEGDDPYECNICGKTFAVPARLTRHYRTHTGEKPYQCEFCNKAFSVKENLSVHRRIHTKERPYKCDICVRAFEHSGKLHRHMRIHTGERPHKCAICSKTFIQSGQLVIHMRTHTGEKPYVCKVCGKGFTCSKQLKVHTRTHTGEKPYTCDICGKSFGYNHVLKLHQVAHYGEKVYKCTICNETFTSKKTMEVHIKSHSEPAVTVTIRNSQTSVKNGMDTGESCGSSSSDKENKCDSDYEIGQQVRMPSRSSSSSVSEYEISERRDMSVSPAPVTYDPVYMSPERHSYDPHYDSSTPSPSHPHTDLQLEQESQIQASIMEARQQPQELVQYFYTKPENNNNLSVYTSHLQHHSLPQQRLSVGVNPVLLAAAAVAAASENNGLSDLSCISRFEEQDSYHQRLQQEEQVTISAASSPRPMAVMSQSSAVLLPNTNPPVYVITSPLPATLRRNPPTYNIQVPFSEDSRSVVIDLIPSTYDRDHIPQDIVEEVREPILTPPSSNPVSPVPSPIPDPIDLATVSREMSALPPRKRLKFMEKSEKHAKPPPVEPPVVSVRYSSVIQYARAS